MILPLLWGRGSDGLRFPDLAEAAELHTHHR
jgi:hypothetical protein